MATHALTHALTHARTRARARAPARHSRLIIRPAVLTAVRVLCCVPTAHATQSRRLQSPLRVCVVCARGGGG